MSGIKGIGESKQYDGKQALKTKTHEQVADKLQAQSCALALFTLDGTPRLLMLSWRAQKRSSLKQACLVLVHKLKVTKRGS